MSASYVKAVSTSYIWWKLLSRVCSIWTGLVSPCRASGRTVEPTYLVVGHVVRVRTSATISSIILDRIIQDAAH